MHDPQQARVGEPPYGPHSRRGEHGRAGDSELHRVQAAGSRGGHQADAEHPCLGARRGDREIHVEGVAHRQGQRDAHGDTGPQQQGLGQTGAATHDGALEQVPHSGHQRSPGQKTQHGPGHHQAAVDRCSHACEHHDEQAADRRRGGQSEELRHALRSHASHERFGYEADEERGKRVYRPAAQQHGDGSCR